MKKLKSDILIVGAGLTGFLAAQAFSDLGVNIIVIDRSSFLSKKLNNSDFRTVAVAEGSKQFMEKLKIWSKIEKFAEPIKDIKVIDRTPQNKLDFYNPIPNKNLGYIVKNSDIKKIILSAIQKRKNVELIHNEDLKQIFYKNEEIICQFKNTEIKSNLLIASDGKNSKVRNIFKKPIYSKKYNQKALVVNFHHEKNHNSTAFELFLDSGPLAILPMKKTYKSKYSSSLVWSHTPRFVKNLQSLDKKLLSLILQEKIYDFVGKIKDIDSVQSFDLSAHINSSFYEERVFYLGDAAHSIHPIAGQGWNIGVRDIEKCLEILKKNLSLGLNLQSLSMLRQYNERAYYDAFSLFQITDKLNLIFQNDTFLSNNIRNIGFDLINKNKKIKNYIVNFAMGFN